MPPLRDQLQSVGYRMTEGLEAQVLGALHARPCAGSFLTGPAGAGKTFLAEAVAQVQERDTFFFQAFPGCRKEELFQTFMPDASQPSGFRLLEGVLPQAARASKAAPTALILDEWDKTHPSTDAFLLDFLQAGRISIPGSQIVANQANLLVFVTLNDERELSEPLMRRLPLIELQTPPLELVADALRDTHAEHPYLGAALALYQRGQMVNLTKPVTIQELRQLLDAITHLGRRADWNTLVFQFVTKNWDDHEMLKSAEALPMDTRFHGLGREPAVLDPSRYESGHARAPQAGDAMPQMPGVRREWLDKIPTSRVETDAERVFGIVPRTDSGYDGVARAVLSRNEHVRVSDPADLDLARVGEHEIIVFKPLEFERAQEWGLILKDGGELLLETRHEGQISQEMLQAFKVGTMQQSPDDPDRCRIYSMTHDELLLRYRGIKVRWTPQKLEVVTRDLTATREFWEYLFGSGGVVTRNRRKLEQLQHEKRFQDSLPPNEKLREDYLFVLRDYK
ncbi:MAG: AAA family ATPase, partial [Candidatus Lambdaproteobacteria bacterium]|nr:AAA family ATPase [Candidatus Lambdaproteobacteria bacterium]